MKKQVSIKIYGKVQGVFFRDSSRAEAEMLGLFGFAKNEDEGTVRIVAEGDDVNLKKFIEWCKYGPDHAEVEKTEITWLPPTGEFQSFLIQ